MPVAVVEFCLGGAAAACAVLFTNPLEVVKTRFQLQGELKAWGTYQRHYRNVFHAFYTIGRYDGLLALQAGLPPALVYTAIQNGTRLGTYQVLVDMGLTKNLAGENSLPRTICAAGAGGYVGALISSPLFLIKTQLQSQSHEVIAVGHQHTHSGWLQGLKRIYVEGGIKGLWRGVHAQTVRNVIGSASQLTAFVLTRDFLTEKEIFVPSSLYIPITSSMVASAAIVVFVTPVDVISIRIYNQGVDARTGRGLYYRGLWDCALKIWRREGPVGFYKGWSASWFRFAPQTILILSFWNIMQNGYYRHFGKKQTSYVSNQTKPP
ncbi:solute carrier family 25 member 35 [Strongylocentrotus purpuratus]|uniref:Solute carrier family 25 member 35 n=1 Tax=Strongylocentrotus purpuratus TaxID=7668 RepID=A0A7M7NW51_STRPU|nr:solute carrier family 25 member 35 [Strongylocentrotus purpuratus]